MDWPYEWRLGARYTRAGRGGRRNRFISFISGVSIIGIALGVAALIIVLSVMNGFQKEVRDRMLAVVAHVEVFDAAGEALPDWAALAQRLQALPLPSPVRGAAPFVQSQALVARGPDMRGAQVRGIDPAAEPAVTPVAAQLQAAGVLARLQPGAWGVVMGADLARSMGLREGDSVTVITPSGQMTPAGVVPRLKRMTLLGTFRAGHQEFDAGLVLMHIDDAARLFRSGGVQGVQLRLADAQAARAAGDALRSALGSGYRVSDWTRSNAAWYDAVQIEKRVMFIILALIVAVAAFNLVATLVMTVTDKQADIAILRTLGASPRSVMGVFMVQGATAGIVGTAAGVVIGLTLALHIDTIVPAIERALGLAFLPGSVYLITQMPSDPQAGDIVPVVLIALALAFVATLYPSWNASRVQPAQALRYE